MQTKADAFDSARDRVCSFLVTNGYQGTHLAVALSGGADSVCLLHILCELRVELSLTVSAIHVHHGIRAEEADHDMLFCRTLCEQRGVELTIFHVDAPSHANTHRMSLESAGRELRYRCFTTYHEAHSDVLIATAHHADDNAETVLFRMARGTGLRGLCGIPAQRDFYVRPCLALCREEMHHALTERGYTHCEDSTNADLAYTRNFIRHEVLPILSRVHEGTVKNISLMTEGLCEDDAFLLSYAAKRLADTEIGRLRAAIVAESPAIAKRMLWLLYEEKRRSADALTAEQMQAALDMIRGDRVHASMSLPCGVILQVERDTLAFRSTDETYGLLPHALTMGVNYFPETGECLVLSEKPVDVTNDLSFNIYKLLIHSTLHFDTMDIRLSVRAKQDGDSYRYGGMTRSLKKLYNEKKLSLQARANRPVVCDEAGILWVPGFGVRDRGADAAEKGDYRIYACYCGFSETI